MLIADDATSVYGTHTDAKVLRKNEIVEIVINNYDSGPHPLHIHGHQVQLVARSSGVYNRTKGHGKHAFLQMGITNDNINATALGFTNTTQGMPATPMRRDTWSLAPNGYTVIRFVADNPGVWFLHCHMEWHMEAGLLMTLVEDPLAIQNGQPNIPTQMQKICKQQNIPLIGNAAGNTQDYLNLTGQVNIAPYPQGATYP
jgi:iron transport multicopper oxidase